MIIVSTDAVLARALEVMLCEHGITDCEIRQSLPDLYDFAVVDLDSADCATKSQNMLTISADRKKGADSLRPFSESVFVRAVADLLDDRNTQTDSAHSPMLTLTEKGFSYKGRQITLTPHEKRIFSLLYHRAGRCVSADEIAKAIGRDSSDGSAVTVYISFLRKKLDMEFGERLITNVRQKGYMLRLTDGK